MQSSDITTADVFKQKFTQALFMSALQRFKVPNLVKMHTSSAGKIIVLLVIVIFYTGK